MFEFLGDLVSGASKVFAPFAGTIGSIFGANSSAESQSQTNAANADMGFSKWHFKRECLLLPIIVTGKQIGRAHV